jgi:hypothetical protein
MITHYTIELDVEHDETSTVEDIADAIQMQLEQNGVDGEADDFGITKSTVEAIFIAK